MRYTPYIISAVIGLLLISTSGCEEDFELNAPYERIPIIYGLLDAGVDTQFVMINRSYLGEGNALDFTTVEDSMLYDEVEAFITWGSNSNERVQLQPIVRTNKDINGIFFAPTQTVYYALTDDIPPLEDEEDNSRFDLEVTADGERITSSTRVPRVSRANIERPVDNESVELRLVNTFDVTDGADYREVLMRYESAANALTHVGSLIFYYNDVTEEGSTERSITILYGSNELDSDGGETVEIERLGDFFYSQLEAEMQRVVQSQVGPEVLYREIGDVEFVLTANGDALSTYLNVGDPISAVGQERPIFSNINAGKGVGVFSSRGTASVLKSFKEPGEENSTPPSMQELIKGQYTGSFCFCDPAPGAPAIWRCGSTQTICQ